MWWKIILGIIVLFIFLIIKARNKTKHDKKKLIEAQPLQNEIKIDVNTLLFRVIPFFNENIDVRNRRYFEGSIRETEKILQGIVYSNFNFHQMRMTKEKRDFFDPLLRKAKIASDKVDKKILNNYYKELGTVYNNLFTKGLLDIKEGYWSYTEYQFIEGLYKILKWKRWLKSNYKDLNQLASNNNIIKYTNYDFNFYSEVPKEWIQLVDKQSCLLITPFINENALERCKYAITVSIHKNNRNWNKNKLLNTYVNGMKDFSNEIINIDEIKFNSLKAKKIKFSYKENYNFFINISILFVNQEGIWSLTFKRPKNNQKKYMHIFKNVIDTFEFID
ncbi:MAG: hypothetical protein ACOCP8_10185 [archaeon]